MCFTAALNMNSQCTTIEKVIRKSIRNRHIKISVLDTTFNGLSKNALLFLKTLNNQMCFSFK